MEVEALKRYNDKLEKSYEKFIQDAEKKDEKFKEACEAHKTALEEWNKKKEKGTQPTLNQGAGDSRNKLHKNNNETARKKAAERSILREREKFQPKTQSTQAHFEKQGAKGSRNRQTLAPACAKQAE